MAGRATSAALLCLILSTMMGMTNQNQRQKRNFEIKLPRILTQNGNLMLTTGFKGNMTFKTDGGKIFLDQIDLKQIIDLVRLLNTTLTSVERLINLNECSSDPCQNGGTCFNLYNTFKCLCTSSFKGLTCADDVDECQASNGTTPVCHNGGNCTNTHGSFRCECPPDWHGPQCNAQYDDCAGASHSDLCGHGSCINDQRVQVGKPKYHCVCKDGWTKSSSDPACTVDIDECKAHPNPCLHQHPPGSCLNTKGSYKCVACSQGDCCGGIRKGQTGNFTSPGFPQPYPSKTTCAWSIISQKDDQIILTFNEFNVEADSGCTSAFLSINDGPVYTSPFRGTFCGSSSIAPIRSSDGALYIEFESNGNSSGKGFAAHWTSVCGRNLFDSAGQFHSPLHPRNYTNNRLCKYRIRVPVGHRVNLVFEEFSLQPSSDGEDKCVNDYVKIYDGIDEDAHILGRAYCGSKVPDLIRSTKNEMLVIFRTDEKITSSGFLANYKAQDTSDTLPCGGEMVIQQGHIESPAYPAYYPHGVNCTWVFIARTGYLFKISFTQIDLQGSYSHCKDYVAVYDGRTINDTRRLERFCGKAAPQSVTSTENSIVVAFVSDDSNSQQGFYATYQSFNSSSVCAEDIYVGGSRGVIQSPNYPNDYPPDLHCEWTLHTDSGKRIFLNVTNLSMEASYTCSHDYLEIRNGQSKSSPLIGKYCNKTLPSLIVSHSNRLYIHFVSDYSKASSGFRLEYEDGNSGCGGDLTEAFGDIASPNFPDKYPNSEECTWTITQAKGSSVVLDFWKFDLENHDNYCVDYVEIHDDGRSGNSLTKHLCGDGIPNTVTSTSNKMWIIMKTDYIYSHYGFWAHYDFSCNNKLTKRYGDIESPNYPKLYSEQVNCSWTIEAPLGNTINIFFIDYENKDSMNTCEASRLEFLDGNSTKSFCTETSENFNSSGSIMTVNFVSNLRQTVQLFHIQYTINGCGDELWYDSGELQSPNYPKAYPQDTHCEWLIKVSSFKSIKLEIIDFNVHSHHSECNTDESSDFIEIYAGSDTSGVLLTRLCNSLSSTSTIESTGNTMFVRFLAGSHHPGRGFKATYTSDNNGCSGKLSMPSGTIASKNYPEKYPLNSECEWQITVNDFHVVQLNFTDFDVEAWECHFDHVKIYDGANATAPLLATLCGHSLDSLEKTQYKSTGNEMFVKMITDSDYSYKGFSASYVTGCGGTIHVDDDGDIHSPNYPQKYNANSQCIWFIHSKDNSKRITLTFTFMNIQSQNDSTCDTAYVMVINGIDADGNSSNKYCGHFIPPSIMSNGSAITLVFQTGKNRATGFRAVYSTAFTACSGTFTSDSGQIQSPGYPSNYPLDTECYWSILVSPGNAISLSFPTFELENNGSVNDDYLEIWAPDLNGQYMGRYYGTDAPTNLTALHGVWIMFRSNHRKAAKGFICEWNTEYGGTLNGASGKLASPHYPALYTKNAHVSWKILLPSTSRKQTVISFQEFQLQGTQSQGCPHDYIQIIDGDETSGKEIGKYCGLQKPEKIYTMSKQLTVNFVSDGDIQQMGFLLKWTEGQPRATPAVKCGRPLTAKHEWAYLKADKEIQQYPKEARSHCVWSITAPLGHSVVASIKNFHLLYYTWYYSNYWRYRYWNPRVYCFKKLELMDGATIPKPRWSHYGRLLRYQLKFKTQYCGNRNPSTSNIKTTSNVLSLHYNDLTRIVRLPRFTVAYRIACGGVVTSLTMGQITSLHYPNSYEHYSSCIWKITVRPGKTMLVTFNSPFNISDTVPCNSQYLQLRDGLHWNSPPLYVHGNETSNTNGKYCGSTAPQTLETSDRYLHVFFKSDQRPGGEGFSFNFTEKSFGCGGTIELTHRMKSRIISSHNYPKSTPPNAECIWHVRAPSSELVQIDFLSMEIDIDYPSCKKSYIQLRDGGSGHARPFPVICGTILPSSQTSTENHLYMRYVTHEYKAGTKISFKARVSLATCGGHLSGSDGQIKSPNFPGSYPVNTHCEWTIAGLPGHYLSININEFDIQKSYNCNKDSLRIQDERNSSSSLFFKCGKLSKNETVRTSADTAYFHFISDSSRVSNGFTTTFKASFEVCGGDLTTPDGTIKSPNYPKSYAHSRSCKWVIKVADGRRVTLTFKDFALHSSSNGKCNGDFVKITNGNLRGSPAIATYCGSKLPPIVESSGNTMTVVFSTDGLGNAKGFKATYSSDKEAICGGLVTDLNGTLGYSTGIYNHFVECLWRIQPNLETSDSSSILFKFANFSLPEPKNRCQYGLVEIIEGDSSDGPVANKVCWKTKNMETITVVPSDKAVILLRFPPSSSQHYFYMTYNVTDCGGTMESTQGTIESPNYPNGYYPNYGCSWLIREPEGSEIDVCPIAIKFGIYFEFGNHPNCQPDYLAIQNGGLPGSPTIGTYCERDKPNNFTSQSNEIRLKMLTDSKLNGRGFQLSYGPRGEGCGGVFHSKKGNIHSPNYPSSYPNDKECTWDIKVSDGFIVTLDWVKPFDIELVTPCNQSQKAQSSVLWKRVSSVNQHVNPCSNSCKDYVEVFSVYQNETSISLGRFCGNRPPPTLYSLTGHMVVVFHSDNMTNNIGFKATWGSQCGGLYTEDHGYFHSPNFPHAYSGGICEYIIYPHVHKHIQIKFHHCNVGKKKYYWSSCWSSQGIVLREYNGKDLGSWKRVCGTCSGSKINSPKGFYLKIDSKLTKQFSGFELDYTTKGCGGIYTEPNGSIELTFDKIYVNRYTNLRCTWKITVARNRTILFKFHSFNPSRPPYWIWYSHPSHYVRKKYQDYVLLYDGPNARSRVIGKYAYYNKPPKNIMSTGNQMFIEASKKSYYQDHFTFDAEYLTGYGPAQGCGGDIRQSSGSISSIDGNNDGVYENNLDCFWTIYANEDMLITLTFDSVALIGDDHCRQDYVKVFDGSSKASTLLGTFCNKSSSFVIQSTTNVLSVMFHTDDEMGANGFKANFTEIHRFCEGIFTATNAPKSISSPNYPEPYTKSVKCQWLIDSGSKYKSVDIQITDFELTEAKNCTQDYLFFWKGSSKLIIDASLKHPEYRHCGSNIPKQFFSSYEQLHITYFLEVNSSSKGFKLNYSTGDCNQNYSGNGGEIRSMLYPSYLPANGSKCTINIDSPESKYVTLYIYDLSFSVTGNSTTNCSNNYMQVTNSSGFEMDKVCSNSSQHPFFIATNRTSIEIVHTNPIRFSLTFVGSTTASGCGGHLDFMERGVVTSPNYPSKTSTAMTCDWHIKPLRGHQLKVYFKSISMADNSRCSTNFVALYDGNSTAGPQHGVYCKEGADKANAIFTKSSMLIHYVNTGGDAPIFLIRFEST